MTGVQAVDRPRPAADTAVDQQSLAGFGLASEAGTRLNFVLQYATAHIRRLDEHCSTDEWPDSEQTFLRTEDKICAEAVLLAYLAKRCDGVTDDAVETLCEVLRPRIFSARTEVALRRYPQTASSLGLACLCLDELGFGVPRFRQLVETSFDRGRALTSEKSPYRLMDVRWTMGLTSPGRLPAADDLYDLTSLATPIHPIFAMTDDEYAVTHALFYLTDFGRRSDPRRSRHIALVEPFLAWSTVRDDLDLLGEHLIIAWALGAEHLPAARFGLEVLEAAWRSTDGLVGPTFDATRHATLVGAEADAYAFGENYHTIFVGGILCAVALSRVADDPSTERIEPTPDLDDWTEPADRTRRAVDLMAPGRATELRTATADEALEDVIGRLVRTNGESVSPPPRWLDVAMSSSLTRSEITAVLTPALVIALARNYELVGLSEALELAVGDPALRGTTARVGLEFLLDQQLPDGFVGAHALLADERGGADVAQAEIHDHLARISGLLDAGRVSH